MSVLFCLTDVVLVIHKRILLAQYVCDNAARVLLFD